MIREFNLYGPNGSEEIILKTVFCNTQKQASEKAKFLFPKSWFSIRIEPTGREFKNIDELIKNRN
jgi:hypothetical protein